MCTILLTNGITHVLVNSADYTALIRWEWDLDADGYASRQVYHNGKTYIIRMHRQILGLTDRAIQCDHINHDRLDNRFSNLRIASNTQNHWNLAVTQRGTSKYKGVCLPKGCKQWRAQITCNRKQYDLGFYPTERQAALAYNRKALELFGEFAHVNVLDD